MTRNEKSLLANRLAHALRNHLTGAGALTDERICLEVIEQLENLGCGLLYSRALSEPILKKDLPKIKIISCDACGMRLTVEMHLLHHTDSTQALWMTKFPQPVTSEYVPVMPGGKPPKL